MNIKTKSIEPPFCIALFAVAFALGAIEGAFFVRAIDRHEWVSMGLSFVLLLVNGVTAGTQIYLIARHVWRTSHERIVIEVGISDDSGDGASAARHGAADARIH